MPKYWLDSNVFITAKNGPYGFDFAPGFWNLLDKKTKEGLLCSSSTVYYELVEPIRKDQPEDQLSAWAKERKVDSIFSEPNEFVQRSFREIANYVKANYEPQQAEDFLEGADPWIIAHARVHGAIVVTCESLAPANSKKVKIPNVCVKFKVDYIDMYSMLRQLGAELIL